MAYSRAVVADCWVFVSGTTGFDYAKMEIVEDIVRQAEQCFRNSEAALADPKMKTEIEVTAVKGSA